MRKRIDRGLLTAALALVAMLAGPSVAAAGSHSSMPPDVDLDPDRGMSFGRLPKTSFDRRVFDPMKQALGSRVMDPAIDPYNPVVRPSRYEPSSGKIRDSLSDKMRSIRRSQEASRKSSAQSARTEAKTSIGSGLVKQRSPSGARSLPTKKPTD